VLPTNFYDFRILTIFSGFGLGSFIEVLQLFSPIRTGDITDALLFGAGGFLGTFALSYFLRDLRPVVSI
jgi:glycopeptide antibiotics resistance protein